MFAAGFSDVSKDRLTVVRQRTCFAPFAGAEQKVPFIVLH